MLDQLDELLDSDGAPAPPHQDPLDAYSRAVAGVAERVGPAVVQVESRGGGRDGQQGGAGAGVVIAGDGLGLTNSNVVAGAPQVRVGIPGRRPGRCGG